MKLSDGQDRIPATDLSPVPLRRLRTLPARLRSHEDEEADAEVDEEERGLRTKAEENDADVIAKYMQYIGCGERQGTVSLSLWRVERSPPKQNSMVNSFHGFLYI